MVNGGGGSCLIRNILEQHSFLKTMKCVTINTKLYFCLNVHMWTKTEKNSYIEERMFSVLNLI